MKLIRNLILISTFLPFLTLCTRDRKLNTIINNPYQTQKVQETNKKIDSLPSIVVHDSSDYSTTFIKSLIPDRTFWKYFLNRNLLIINNQDTSIFPEYPQIGNVVILSNKKGVLEIKLTVDRILQSSIEYKIEFIENGIPKLIRTGSADLSPLFFLGSESDTDDTSGYSYFCAEYWDKSVDYLAIRIGKEPINEKTYLGKIRCSLESYKIDLNNFPTLKEN